MGILNITPDSIYDGCRNLTLKHLISTLKSLMKADIIDIGGYSSKPGAKKVKIDEEHIRVIQAIELIKNELTFCTDFFYYGKSFVFFSSAHSHNTGVPLSIYYNVFIDLIQFNYNDNINKLINNC